jgi:hypothetical protein
VLETADLARQLPAELQGEWHDALCAKAARFWEATEMRENLTEPWLQLARELQEGPDDASVELAGRR